MPRLERLAAAGAGLVLLVIVASAAIRLGVEAPATELLRVTHRTAASAAVLVVAMLGWLAWRTRRARAPAAAAAALIVLLSLVGVAGGQNPPFGASLGNILGGLALAATLAWLAGARAAHRPLLAVAVLAQCALGAWLSLGWRELPPALLVAHALLGLALAAAAALLASRTASTWLRAALILLAVIVPAAGAAAAFLDRALVPSLAHAGAVALLVCALVYAHSRPA
jgi:hypothetical protein